MHALHLFLFALGAMAVIVYAIRHDNPKLEGEPAFVLITGIAFMVTAIWSFLSCLFSKPEGQYQKPGTPQHQEHEQEHKELTATH